MRRIVILFAVFGSITALTAIILFRPPAVVRPTLDAIGSQAVKRSETSFQIGNLGWNRLRGPNGRGVIEDDKIPLEWDDEKNIAWKVELPGIGSSSPVLSDDRVFVSACEFDKQSNGELAWIKRYTLAYDRTDGTELWKHEIDGILPEDPFRGNGLPEHGYATNTATCDDAHVYFFLGKSGVYCFDLDCNEVWKKDVGRGSNPKGWGSCSSLILYDRLLIVNAAEESNAIIAFDKLSGDEVWRIDSPSLHYAFSTPALVEVEDSFELVFVLVGEVWGLNPATGKLLWYAQTPMAGNVSPTVLIEKDLVYCFGGYRSVGSICVQAGGRGDVTDSHVKWTSKLTSYVSSPILFKNRIYWIDSKSIYYCQDASTGDLIARGRSQSLGGPQPVYASVLAINGKIVLQSRHEGVLVMEANEDMTLLHQNQTKDTSTANATPAADNGQLFLRSDDYLICVAAGSEAGEENN
ncbi:MAG: PQQ-binding-like beta-propeller repeat protein [Planctomycetota bacterium]